MNGLEILRTFRSEAVEIHVSRPVFENRNKLRFAMKLIVGLVRSISMTAARDWFKGVKTPRFSVIVVLALLVMGSWCGFRYA